MSVPGIPLPADLEKELPAEQPAGAAQHGAPSNPTSDPALCTPEPAGPAVLHAGPCCGVDVHAPYATPSSEPSRAPRRQARAKELRQELLNSARLAAHFEEHPGDLALLQHDRPLAKAAAPAHLRHLPAYLRAQAAGGACAAGNTGRGAPALPPGCAGSDECGCAWQDVTVGQAAAAPLPRARPGVVRVCCAARSCVGGKGCCSGMHATSHHVHYCTCLFLMQTMRERASWRVWRCMQQIFIFLSADGAAA
jgi:hypothetical protein